MVSGRADVSTVRRSNESLSAESGELPVRATLITAIAETMSVRGLSQVQAAKLCRTDQPTLSKVLRGRTMSVTLDKLVGWLLALGRSVEIRVAQTNSGNKGKLTAVVDE